MSYGMMGIQVISHLRWLFPPLVPYGTTFPPLSGGTIKLRGGKPLHERSEVGLFSDARRAVVKVLYKLAPSINLEAPSTTLSGIAAVKLKNPRGDSPVKL